MRSLSGASKLLYTRHCTSSDPQEYTHQVRSQLDERWTGKSKDRQTEIPSILAGSFCQVNVQDLSFSHVIREYPTPLQVRCGHSLQISTQARVDWQELGLLGALPLQQLLGGSPQQQRADHRALAPPATRRGPVRLRRRLRDLLRCGGLPAPAHISRLLCAARLSCVQRVE